MIGEGAVPAVPKLSLFSLLGAMPNGPMEGTKKQMPQLVSSRPEAPSVFTASVDEWELLQGHKVDYSKSPNRAFATSFRVPLGHLKSFFTVL